MIPSSPVSRRRFLTATTAAVALPAVATADGRREPAQETTIRLESDLKGWRGVAPDRIAGETNPTLYLTAGEAYELVWENADGVGHSLFVKNDDGDTVEQTETVGDEGETRSAAFTATEDLADYHCGIHSSSMRGEIAFGDEPTTTEATTDDGGETTAETTPATTTAEDDDVTTSSDEMTTSGDEDNTDGGGLPGFGVLAAVGGLLGALGLRRRRQR